MDEIINKHEKSTMENYVIDTKKDVATGIRLPRSLKDKIDQAAEKEFRTFNSMLVFFAWKGSRKMSAEKMFLRLYRKMLDMERRLVKMIEKKDNQ